MKKAVLICPRQAARELVPGPDLDRYLKSGSWLVVDVPKQPTPGTLWQREFRKRRLAEGYGFLHALLPRAVLDALHDQKRDGETMAALIERLVVGNADRNSGG